MSPSEVHAPEAGALIGRWRVLERVGSGSYGIVYRVCLAEEPGAGEYALKLARYPGDLRYEREGELLSRIHHPHVPSYRDQGIRQGAEHGWYPHVVMQWVEGLPLYQWAKQRGITSRQVLRVVGQVARALEATHVHGVHRDVKGDNVLVTAEGEAVLVDFGCCWYEGARPLTNGMLPPGTRPYRSPQARRHKREGTPDKRYVGSAADDVYALGVTAYRLVTGTYPPQDTEEAPRLLPPSDLATVAPELEALILRMLSEYPSVRGSAGEVAEALEQAARSAGRVADERVRPSPSMLPTEPALRPGPTRWQLARQVLRQAVRQHALALSVTGTLAVCVLGVVLALVPLQERPVRLATVEEAEPADAGVEERTVGLADAGVDDSVLAAAQAHAYGAPAFVLGEPIPDKPEPGQKKPPCNQPAERAINGGCWFPLQSKPPCPDYYEHDRRCYAPVLLKTRRPPTSKEP